ncbi:hypothetical protein LCGC14_1055510 [marine sediment metagenome]|uniref:Uncharacterized protein n=1 Tax=marine sediment metagenome TaxID=412755 RepID=A0A0F9Q5N5_9ZZZZ
MKNDNNTILWIIGIVAVVFLILPNFQTSKETGIIGLIPHYYKDGVEVFPEKGLFGFTIVTPPGGSYDQIAFDISATNQDVPISNIQVVDASPQTFKDALVGTTPQTLAIQETKTLWISNLMGTAQFESMTQPIRFFMNISAVNDYTGEIEYATGYIDLTIESERPIETFSLVDSTEYSVSIYGDSAWHDIHNYGTVTTSTTLSKIDSLVTTEDLLTSGSSIGVSYRFLFVGDNTGDKWVSSEISGTYGSGSYDSFSWDEGVVDIVGDTSYSIILQGRVNGGGYTRIGGARNMDLNVLYLIDAGDSFSLVDSTEYSVSIYGDNAWHDIHNYGTITTPSTLSKVDSLIVNTKLLTSGGSIGSSYKFKIVGDNTGDKWVSSEISGTYGSGSYDSFWWRENINLQGDTSYSIILQGRVNGAGYTRIGGARNMDLNVLI